VITFDKTVLGKGIFDTRWEKRRVNVEGQKSIVSHQIENKKEETLIQEKTIWDNNEKPPSVYGLTVRGCEEKGRGVRRWDFSQKMGDRRKKKLRRGCCRFLGRDEKRHFLRAGKQGSQDLPSIDGPPKESHMWRYFHEKNPEGRDKKMTALKVKTRLRGKSRTHKKN